MDRQAGRGWGWWNGGDTAKGLACFGKSEWHNTWGEKTGKTGRGRDCERGKSTVHRVLCLVDEGCNARLPRTWTVVK